MVFMGGVARGFLDRSWMRGWEVGRLLSFGSQASWREKLQLEPEPG